MTLTAVQDREADNSQRAPDVSSPIEGTDSPEQIPNARKNFLLLAAFHIAVRCGWIFKTESIMIPFVLDLLGGGAWIRSFLPLLNRFGQSVPPLMLARRIKIMPRKKWALAASSLLMSACFLLLAGVWNAGTAPGANWLPWVFLAIYALFFMSVGVNLVSFSTVQGKLVATRRRGALLLTTNFVGAAISIALIVVLLPRWLTSEGSRFELIFGFTGICFGIATLVSALLVEPRDDYHEPAENLGEMFWDVVVTLRNDRRFLRLAIIGALFSTSVILFPHYQAVGLSQRMKPQVTDIIWWIVIQNIGTAIFSLFVGPLADRRGNRAVLRVVLPSLTAAPLLALAIAYLGPNGRTAFPLVFILVGLVPVTLRTMHNYTLEMAGPPDHPRYLSTINVAMAVPILFSPLLGWLIDLTGFTPTFLGVSAAVGIGWLMTYGLYEPRLAADQVEQSP